jgi:hypothetical protein
MKKVLKIRIGDKVHSWKEAKDNCKKCSLSIECEASNRCIADILSGTLESGMFVIEEKQ